MKKIRINNDKIKKIISRGESENPKNKIYEKRNNKAEDWDRNKK